VVPASSRDDWQKEARKLELQGKLEQAEAIRASILQTKAPPWPVANASHVEALIQKVFVERAVGNKGSQQLFEYAAFYDAPELAERLAQERQFSLARHFVAQRPRIVKARLASYSRHHFNEIWNDCDRYGLEHRTPMNQTPLMAAARAGNVALVEALLEKGAPGQLRSFGPQRRAHRVTRGVYRSGICAGRLPGPVEPSCAPWHRFAHQ